MRPWTCHVEEWHFTYVEQTGVLDGGDWKEQSERSGSVTIQGASVARTSTQA